MKIAFLWCIALTALMLTYSPKSEAGFPQDFSDVLWVEGIDISGWSVTSELTVSVVGDTLVMPHSKRDSWPRSSRLGFCCNSNIWGFVKIGNVWMAGTWEYMRPGQVSKKIKAFGGCCHFRPPISNFSLVNGEVYGFMVGGVARDGLSGNNVKERTNLVLYRWGEGPIAVPSGGSVAPAVDLLLAEPEVI